MCVLCACYVRAMCVLCACSLRAMCVQSAWCVRAKLLHQIASQNILSKLGSRLEMFLSRSLRVSFCCSQILGDFPYSGHQWLFLTDSLRLALQRRASCMLLFSVLWVLRRASGWEKVLPGIEAIACVLRCVMQLTELSYALFTPRTLLLPCSLCTPRFSLACKAGSMQFRTPNGSKHVWPQCRSCAGQGFAPDSALPILVGVFTLSMQPRCRLGFIISTIALLSRVAVTFELWFCV